MASRKNKIVSSEVPRETFDWYLKRARQEDRSLSSVIRKGLIFWMSVQQTAEATKDRG